MITGNRYIRTALAALLALCLALSLAACGEKPAQPAGPSQGGSAGQDPQGGGSAEGEIRQASLKLSKEELTVIDGATAMLPYYKAAVARILGVSEDEAASYVLCSKTDGAYSRLIEKSCDMVFCALPSESQVQWAADSGVEFESVDILNSGFVFFVNKDNPVDGLSSEQIHDIYAGKITNWKEVGGNDEPIEAFQRSEGSGSQTGLYLHVISPEELMPAPTEKMIGAMEGIIDVVANFDSGKGAIGYSYYYYVVNMHYDEDIKMIAVDGVMPDPETIGDGSYPYISRTCAVFRSDEPEDSNVRKIAEWCHGPEGCALAEELGYVPNREDQ